MFIPPVFAEHDLPTLHRFIRQNSFGVVVSQVDGLPTATHLPILLDPAQGPYGTLEGHFARANPQWQDLADQTSLVIFTGPHVYVSPTWYEAKNTVPTWNYTAVHATGRAELIEDRDSLRRFLQHAVDFYEGSLPQPWTFEGTSTFVERMLDQIVGFRLVIERLEGKFKLNQNHPAERRERVITQLTKQGDENSLAIAEMMRERMPTEE